MAASDCFYLMREIGFKVLGSGNCLPTATSGDGRLSDYGIRFVWYSALLGPKAPPMYGTAHANDSRAG
jgi:hypothetical protein